FFDSRDPFLIERVSFPAGKRLALEARRLEMIEHRGTLPAALLADRAVEVPNDHREGISAFCRLGADGAMLVGRDFVLIIAESIPPLAAGRVDGQLERPLQVRREGSPGDLHR